MINNQSPLIAKDFDALIHPSTNFALHRETGPMVIDKGDGIYVTDTEGRTFIEGMAGLWCTALGYGVEELVEAARKQMEKLAFGHMFAGRANEPGIELAAHLKDMTPITDAKIFFGNSGSDANDTQVKLIWYYNN